MKTADKNLNMIKATARYNLPGFVGAICGPVTGFEGNRVKRLSLIKDELVMWEGGCPDVTFEKGDILPHTARIVALNFPAKMASNYIIYSSYIDIDIKGYGTNRIMIDVAKINGSFERTALSRWANGGPEPFMVSKSPVGKSVPQVSGWVKDPDNPPIGDVDLNAPVCPEGCKPAIKNYVQIEKMNYMSPCLGLGLPGDFLPKPEYIRTEKFTFDNISSSGAGVGGVSAGGAASSGATSAGAAAKPKTITKTITEKVSKILVGKREFTKSGIEQLFAYVWVRGYNKLTYDEAAEKLLPYFTENGYIDDKEIAKEDIEHVLTYVWARRYNDLDYDGAAEKIVDYLTKEVEVTKTIEEPNPEVAEDGGSNVKDAAKSAPGAAKNLAGRAASAVKSAAGSLSSGGEEGAEGEAVEESAAASSEGGEEAGSFEGASSEDGSSEDGSSYGAAAVAASTNGSKEVSKTASSLAIKKKATVCKALALVAALFVVLSFALPYDSFTSGYGDRFVYIGFMAMGRGHITLIFTFIMTIASLVLAIVTLVAKGENGLNKSGKPHITAILSVVLSFAAVTLNTLLNIRAIRFGCLAYVGSLVTLPLYVVILVQFMGIRKQLSDKA